MKKLFTLLSLIVTLFVTANAQIVTPSPLLLQESSTNVTLTYNAASPLGNGGLKGMTANDPVYVHIGVITNKSTGNSDWKYVLTSWPSSASDANANTSKNRLTYQGNDLWSLNVGNIRTFFGITDANEKIQKIAMVFRNASGSREGKTSGGGDIFVDVLEEGYKMLVTSNVSDYVMSQPTTISFTCATSQASTITMTVNGTTVGTATNSQELKQSYYFQNNGSYNVVFTATNGTETLSQTISVIYPQASSAANYPGGVPKMGTVKNADGTVTFCLAAPQKQSVILVPSWDNYEILDKNIMSYQDYNGQRYFWITVSGLDNSTWYPYYYVVDGSIKVADPYANLILDCYSDKWLDDSIWPDRPQYPYDHFDSIMLGVYRGDLNGNYKFSDFTIPNHQNLVVYEMLFRDFTGTEGAQDGNGTVRAAIAKIPYLKSLGVNAVELMPIMEFNGNNSWGYNPNFYMAPDKAYGSPTDYKDFVEACHQAGIAVILDIVFNQSDGLHPWYMMYPIANSPFYNQTAPHDWSVLNDWKQQNDLVQQQWQDAIKYWMTEYNVDGFRFDLVKGLAKEYPNGTDAYNSSRIAVMKSLCDAIHSVKPNGIHINEGFLSASEEKQNYADGGQLAWYSAANSSMLNFAAGNASNSSAGNFATDAGGRTWGSVLSYAESHDEQRLGYQQLAYGQSSIQSSLQARMNRLGQVAVQMLLTPGPKMIWQFGELGNDENTKSSDGSNNTSPKTVVWDYLNDANRHALYNTYAALCTLRQDSPELFVSGTTFNLSENASSFGTNRVITLRSGNKEVVALINPGFSGPIRSVSASVSNMTASNYQVVTYSDNFTETPAPTFSSGSVSVKVPINGYVVLATKGATGVDDIIGDSNATTVIGGEGCIIINGDYNRADIYNLSGQQMNSLNVPAGIYIVRVDGNATKVVVR
jgi:1,4-alpha-glucan branching enzyme